MISPLLARKRTEILHTSMKYGAHNVCVFGSMARGNERDDSDVDLLVEFEPDRSLMDHAGLVIELEALLGRTVEIGTRKGLREPHRARILSEAVPL